MKNTELLFNFPVVVLPFSELLKRLLVLGAMKNLSLELNSLSASWGACLVINYPCVSNKEHREILVASEVFKRLAPRFVFLSAKVDLKYLF